MGKGSHGGGGRHGGGSHSHSSHSHSHGGGHHHHGHHHHGHHHHHHHSSYGYYGGTPIRCSCVQCLSGVLLIIAIGLLIVSILSISFGYSTSSYSNAHEAWLHKNDADLTWYECINVKQSSQSTAYALSSKPEVTLRDPYAFDFIYTMDHAGWDYEYFAFQLLPGSLVTVGYTFSGTVSVYVLVDDDEFAEWESCPGCFAPVQSAAAGTIIAPVEDAGDVHFVFDKWSPSSRGSAEFTGTKTRYEIDEDSVLDSFRGKGEYCVPWSKKGKSLYMLLEGPDTDPCNDACWTAEHKVTLSYGHRWSFVGPTMACVFLFLVATIVVSIFFMLGGARKIGLLCRCCRRNDVEVAQYDATGGFAVVSTTNEASTAFAPR